MKVLLALLIVLSSPAFGLGTDRYDGLIRQASDTWLPGQDWLRYRALLYQESLMDPEAVSHVGAEGIAQFMPGTWRDVTRAMGWGAVSPRQVDYAIQGGAFYLSGRMKVWTSKRPFLERRRLGEACYNAGCGNIIEAQKLCYECLYHCGCTHWGEISLFLHRVTGRHSAETIQYVERIEHWYQVMK